MKKNFLLVFSLIVVTAYSQEQNQSLYFKAGISFPMAYKLLIPGLWKVWF